MGLCGLLALAAAGGPARALDVQEAGTAIAGSSGSPDLNTLLGAVIGLGPPGVEAAAWLALNPEEAATGGTAGVEMSSAAVVNVGARLVSLRAGAGSLFSFNGSAYARPVLLALADTGTASDAPPVTAGTGGFRRLGFFLNASGSYGDRDSSVAAPGPGPDFAFAGEPGFDFDAWGLTGGADYRLADGLVAGISGSYSSAEADLDFAAGSLEADQYAVSAYGTFYTGPFYVDAIATFGWTDYEARRTVSVPAIGVGASARSDFDGDHFSVSLGAGYDVARGGWTAGPYGRLSYFEADIDGYREEISGTAEEQAARLAIGKQEIDSLQSALGAQVSYALSTQVGVLVPQLRLEWVHEFQDDSRDIEARWVENTTNVTPFAIPTDDPDRNFFHLGVGLSGQFPHGVAGFLYYETPLGLEDVVTHNVTGGVRFAF
ncbi:MAG: hypothetical protein Kow0092_38850 [Deferrisomatales bacterium]